LIEERRLSIVLIKMIVYVALLLLLVYTNAKTLSGSSCNKFITTTTSWQGGENGKIRIGISSNAVSWNVQIRFSNQITDITLSEANKVSSSNKQIYTFSNKPYNKYLQAGSTLTLNYNFYYPWSSKPTPKITYIKITTSTSQSCGTMTGGTTTGTVRPPATSRPSVTSGNNGKYCTPAFSYKKALHASILFYEAQRSGKLPSNNRIPWRKSSTENDGKHLGVDLTGGYFDAGDYVKFNFPQAAAMTMLAWGMVEFSEGYKFAGEYKYGLDTLRWGMDYFMKCHTKPNEFYGQVGSGNEDHAFWGRPQEYRKLRPCYKLDTSHPGSDLVGEVAASLAATSIVFKHVDSAYSQKLLSHSKQLYRFADQYRGKYSDSIKDAANFYKSYSGYMDELGLAAIWIYKATGDRNYLTAAEKHWQGLQKKASEISWDNKGRAVAILLAKATRKSAYVYNAKEFCEWAIKKAPRTPSNMIFVQQWGSNRHAANIAFACLAFSKDTYGNFAREQINIILGNNKDKRSFVVGFGNNPPLRSHHAGASCPSYGSCNWDNFQSSRANPQVLTGALVGGPKDLQGTYNDKRDDFITNEVTLDYNAGFQSALAGLLELQSNGKCY